MTVYTDYNLDITTDLCMALVLGSLSLDCSSHTVFVFSFDILFHVAAVDGLLL